MNVEDIKKACHSALNDFKIFPHNGITFCNIAVWNILTDLGFPDFVWDNTNKRPMLANDIVEKAIISLKELKPMEAFESANAGEVVIACLKEPNHGHVAIVYPFPVPQTSGKWNRTDLPVVANIGKDVGIMPVNYAFGAMPRFFKVSLC